MKIFILLMLFLSLNACVSNSLIQKENNTKTPFTHGNVQLTLKKGVTDQSEVLNNFGPPNIATIDSEGREVWTYQKHATIAKSEQAGSYGTIILFGGSASSSGFEQSSRTMTLIIKFDKQKFGIFLKPLKIFLLDLKLHS